MPGGGYRERTLSGSVISETQQENSAYPAVYSRCDDEVNRRDRDNPLTIDFVSRNWIPLNGVYLAGNRIYRNYFPTAAYGNLSHNSELMSSIPSVGEVALATLARSNPSRPAISIPNFLYELKDLPGMIRDIGRIRLQAKNFSKTGLQGIHPKVASNHYLSYVMGWSPLISDLRKLLDFQSHVDKKATELHNLYANGGLQRRVRSNQWKRAADRLIDDIYTIESLNGRVINSKVTEFSQVERWGTVRWTPASLPPFDLGSRDMGRLARDLAFGMKGISPKQAWDAIPWSWLVSWFTNVDDFLGAHHNAIPLVHSTPCVMTKRFTRRDFTRIPGNEPHYTGGDGCIIRETKERVTNSGSLSASIPFLNGRQFSILGALHIQRSR
ncbi:MAG: putative maturation protein [Alehxovirus faecivicinum]|uniref:Maturation protein n=1 Tax=Leviviridae sp. TaxID=2027243 RepID=A0ABY3SV85_9VIRU|nr:MAG: putative maturation protein [Leviviridae sp.]